MYNYILSKVKMFSPQFVLALSNLMVYHHFQLILNHPYVYNYIPGSTSTMVTNLSLDSVSICPVSIW